LRLQKVDHALLAIYSFLHLLGPSISLARPLQSCLCFRFRLSLALLRDERVLLGFVGSRNALLGVGEDLDLLRRFSTLLKAFQGLGVLGVLARFAWGYFINGSGATWEQYARCGLERLLRVQRALAGRLRGGWQRGWRH